MLLVAVSMVEEGCVVGAGEPQEEEEGEELVMMHVQEAKVEATMERMVAGVPILRELEGTSLQEVAFSNRLPESWFPGYKILTPLRNSTISNVDVITIPGYGDPDHLCNLLLSRISRHDLGNTSEKFHQPALSCPKSSLVSGFLLCIATMDLA